MCYSRTGFSFLLNLLLCYSRTGFSFLLCAQKKRNKEKAPAALFGLFRKLFPLNKKNSLRSNSFLFFTLHQLPPFNAQKVRPEGWCNIASLVEADVSILNRFALGVMFSFPKRFAFGTTLLRLLKRMLSFFVTSFLKGYHLFVKVSKVIYPKWNVTIGRIFTFNVWSIASTLNEWNEVVPRAKRFGKESIRFNKRSEVINRERSVSAYGWGTGL